MRACLYAALACSSPSGLCSSCVIILSYIMLASRGMMFIVVGRTAARSSKYVDMSLLRTCATGVPLNEGRQGNPALPEA